MRTTLAFSFCACLLLLSSARIQAGTVAYTTGNQTGNQTFGGPLGMDFDVVSPIQITALGVFDSGQNGLQNPLTVYIYNRDTQAAVATLNFATGNTGTLLNGSRFLNLLAPLVLPVGFHGSVVGEGYGTNEPNGNGSFVGFTAPTTNTGGGLIAFVGTSRFGLTAGAYPPFPDSMVAQYGSGTFQFDAVTSSIPEPTSLLLVAVSLFGLACMRSRMATSR